MKDIPILFSTPMVQAILEGQKTMTRRIVKTTHKGWNCQMMELVQSENISESFFDNTTASPSLKKELTGFHAFFKDNESDHKLGIKCKYGQPGDVLWVRETAKECNDGIFAYKADYSEEILTNQLNKGIWKPSIHMPKAAARIWLQVEEIRVERLHDISEEDMMCEGIRIPTSERNTPCFVLGADNSAFSFLPDGCLADGAIPPTQKQILFAYWAELWCKINGRESWDLNPWVWVVKFKVLSTTGKPQPETRNP